ncbi:MAG: hypothetical protein QOF37_2225 [Thermoleophilaceae bacterium]|nr:hypothetical protein [Thermoleophilaceae bacterium]
MITPLAIFGISNSGLDLAVKLVLLFFVAIWAALVFWTYADARRRIEDPMLVGCATAASFFFPFVGSIIYAIVRPPEYIEDVHERELEIAAAEARLQHVEGLHCPHCDFEIEKTFLRCPSCLRRLKEPCGTCGRPLDPRWKICPYCEAEVGQAAPRQARRARRSATPGSTPTPAPAPAPAAAPPRNAVPRPQPDRTTEQPSVSRSRPPAQ